VCPSSKVDHRLEHESDSSSRISHLSLCCARSYLHEHGIVHRDLKFENIMFEDESEDADIKLIDFGLSKKFMGKPGYMTERVGTMYVL
jgi:calcium-dependent protein kinase